MIKCASDQREFISGLLQEDRFQISNELWNFAEKFIAAFRPVAITTLTLQKEQFTMGDFYKSWLECELDLKSMNNVFSQLLLQAMNARKSKLFDCDAFLAAMYMDPRFTYLNSDILSKQQKQKAKVSFLTYI